MEIKNFCEIKAIDEARIKKIIRWYEKTRFKVAIMASEQGPGYNLNVSSLIKLLAIFGNSKQLDKDFRQFDSEI